MLRKTYLFILIMAVASAAHATLIAHYDFENNWLNNVSGSGFPTMAAQGGATFASDIDRGNVASLISTRWAQGGNAAGQFDDLSTQITIALWVKSSQTNNYANRRIIGRRDSWGIDVAGGANASFFIDGTTSLTGTAQINDNNWHHIAVTWDALSGERKLYVDGFLDAQDVATVGAWAWGSGHFAIAARATAYSTADAIYRGYMDDVRIYNDVQSLSQIQQFSGIPEPATICMLGFGAFGLIRRKR